MSIEASSRGNVRQREGIVGNSALDTAVRGLRRDAEDLLREYGTDKRVGGIKGVATFVGSYILGNLPKDASYRKILELPLSSEQEVLYIETVDRGIPSAASRIDMILGHKKRSGDFFYSDGVIVPEGDGRFIGIDLEHRGTLRYHTFGGSDADIYSISPEQATRYHRALERAREKLTTPAA